MRPEHDRSTVLEDVAKQQVGGANILRDLSRLYRTDDNTCSMADVDELYAVRNNFLVGNFQVAIDECSATPPLSQQKTIEMKVFLYRARLALGDAQGVIADINEAPMALEAVKYLAAFMLQPGKREACLGKVLQSLEDELTTNNGSLRMVGGIMHAELKQYTEALSVLKGPGATTPEHAALRIQILLKMNRLDVAQRELAELTNSSDDDAVVTQLAQGWVYAAMGGSKCEEASYIFQELMDKFDPTVMLMNSLAVCKLHMEQYPEADELLQSALEENPDDVDTIVNSIVVGRHMNKPEEEVRDLLAKLAQKDPNNIFLAEWKEAAANFDSLAATFK